MWALVLAVVLSGCDSSVSPDPTPSAPSILIEGVEEGGQYTDPVSIEITVEGGSWEASLNGERIGSSHVVATPGSYHLEVIARDGLQETRRDVSFQIILDGDSQLIVRMIDLGDNPLGGGGDALLLTDSSAAGVVHVLVDAGTGPSSGGANGNTNWVSQRLEDFGVDTLAALLLTHAHEDHYLGMQAVLRDVHVERFIYNGETRTTTSYLDLLDYAAGRTDSVIVVDSMLEYTLGAGTGEGTRLVILTPLPHYLDNSGSNASEINEGSIGAYVQRGDFTLFLTGDGEHEANQRWRTDFPEYTETVEVLKVGHHGANDAIFDAGSGGPASWVEHTDPAVALISANGRSHPRINALARLRSGSDRVIFCTHVHGTVELRISPTGRYFSTPARNPGQGCTAGSEATS
jgi:beta-lactamase superfamily II metal-dependent hydrolase